MHISTANVFKIVKDTTNITNAIKYEAAYGLSISVFRFDLGLF